MPSWPEVHVDTDGTGWIRVAVRLDGHSTESGMSADVVDDSVATMGALIGHMVDGCIERLTDPH